MENHFYFCADFDMQICIPNTNLTLFLQKNERGCIVCDENELCVVFTPSSPKECIAPEILCVKLINNQVLCTNACAHFYKLMQNQFKVVLNFKKLLCYTPQKLLTTTIINDLSLAFLDGTMQCIVLNNNEQSSRLFLNEQITSPHFLEFDKYYALTGKRAEQDYVLVFDKTGNTIFEGYDDKIEIVGNQINALKIVHDTAQHGFVSKYELKNNKISEVECYSVYLKQTPLHATNKYVVPVAFLEAINLDNLKLARFYLCDQLNISLKDEQLTQYFGDFLEFESNFLHDMDNSFIFYYNNGMTKLFRFVVKDNKIVDILCD